MPILTTAGTLPPRLQLLTISQILDGRQIEMPPASETQKTFKKAKKIAKDTAPGEQDVIV